MGLSCTEEGGNGPSLGCTEQGGNGYTKGEEREVIHLYTPLFSGHFCPAGGQREEVAKVS